MTPLEKTDVIDRHFALACSHIVGWFQTQTSMEELRQIARARHILGHYEYGDANLFEWSDGKVRAAILEELADAVVYQAWILQRAEDARPY